ncbi:MAG: type II toxin-antitoxin system VapC family toxin [Sandaracinus sp.]
MKHPHEPLVLDTNIVVQWLRGKAGAERLRADYDLGGRRPRPVLPVVVKGEILSFARQNGWGTAKMDRLHALVAELPVADISSEAVIDAYAVLDELSIRAGRRMEKNDLWIAAVARVLGAVLLTTDGDFEVLHPGMIRVERLDALTLSQT